MQVARIALDVPLPQLFDYRVPESMLVQSFMRVRVPFGRRSAIGLVVAIAQTSDFPIDKLKQIEQVIDDDPLYDAALGRLFLWAANYYVHSIGDALFHALPARLRQGEPLQLPVTGKWTIIPPIDNEKPRLSGLTPKQRLALALLNDAAYTTDALIEQGISLKTLLVLQKKARIALTSTEPTLLPPSITPAEFEINAEQRTAIDAIQAAYQRFTVWLLEGITGSGKTEVYFQVIVQHLIAHNQVLVLVPEISLTPQTIARFRARFQVTIDVLHSGLTDLERLNTWLRAREGISSIVIGTRSAIFTPFRQLGIIIIDEEHDSSYKQQEGWRYHARDIAIMRARNAGIPIVLGSATPAMETLHNVHQQKYQRLMLSQRAGDAQMVQHAVIDIKGSKLTNGLSQPMIAAIRQHLCRGDQVMLFLNRRGYAPVLMCHDCGWIATCPRCDSYYTYHQHSAKLACHHCDTQKPVLTHCPSCQHNTLSPVGVGTEQLSAELPRLFPEIPITRIDSDTTRRKGALEAQLNEINQGGARLLIGTQILAKGHHFPDVTLVGIIDADGALFSTDFRATEHFAQLYTQVAGRAGREAKAGHVILQTHHPKHPLLQCLLIQGYGAFAEQVLNERRQVPLPPFTHQVLLRTVSLSSSAAQQFLAQARQYCLDFSDDVTPLWVLGPYPASRVKVAGKYRWHLLLQHHDRRLLHHALLHLIANIKTLPQVHHVRWSVDVDPIDS